MSTTVYFTANNESGRSPRVASFVPETAFPRHAPLDHKGTSTFTRWGNVTFLEFLGSSTDGSATSQPLTPSFAHRKKFSMTSEGEASVGPSAASSMRSVRRSSVSFVGDPAAALMTPPLSYQQHSPLDNRRERFVMDNEPIPLVEESEDGGEHCAPMPQLAT